MPAVKKADGTKIWHKEGKLHRDGDKPTIIGGDGTQKWLQNGIPHRDPELGPAVIYPDGEVEYWIEGKEVCGPDSK